VPLIGGCIFLKKRLKLAAALKYIQEETKTPVIVAAGKGLIAENIIKKAEDEGIPVYEDDLLAEILASMEVGSEIPEELYAAVAQIIAFVWKMDKKYMED
jgi:flagellar biosynthesis protein